MRKYLVISLLLLSFNSLADTKVENNFKKFEFVSYDYDNGIGFVKHEICESDECKILYFNAKYEERTKSLQLIKDGDCKYVFGYYNSDAVDEWYCENS